MKTLIAALLLASVAVPVLAAPQAFTLGSDGVSVESTLPGLDIFGRRSGRCREGSTCGGV